MREPKALNTLAEESEELRSRMRSALPEGLPSEVESLFDEFSELFSELTIDQWREEKRFDELIDYMVYQYDKFDGHKPWEQVLLDLRLNKQKKKAIKLLEGLLKQREKLLRSTVSRLSEDPENLGLQIALTMHKSSVLSLLTEIELVILVKPLEDSYKEQHEKIKKQIKKTLNYGQRT